MMAKPTLSEEDLRALEQARQRLIQLTTAIQSFQAGLAESDPLPSWSSFQSQVKIITQHIEGVSNTLSENDKLLSRLAVVPLPEFPTRTQEGLLGQLLRKKVEPGIEDWIAEGLGAGHDIPTEQSGQKLNREELEELWSWAPEAVQNALREYVQAFGTNYTNEERALGTQNVVTGLKRQLPDTLAESDDEADSDDDSMKDDSKPTTEDEESLPLPPSLPVHNQLKFMTTGVFEAPPPTPALVPAR